MKSYLPFISKARKRKALQLGENQFAKIKDTLSGKMEVVAGPDEEKDMVRFCPVKLFQTCP